jgi:cysteinyl-tRNA synthetase
MDLSWDSLKAAHILIQRWREKITLWQQDKTINLEQVKKLVDEIVLYFSQDLDTPRAIQKLRALEKDDSISDGVKFEVFKSIDPLFGLELLKSTLKAELPDDLAQLLAARQVARDSKDFNESDRLRDLLAQNGIAVKDNKQGQEWDWQL